jgi:hypothetical protein
MRLGASAVLQPTGVSGCTFWGDATDPSALFQTTTGTTQVTTHRQAVLSMANKTGGAYWTRNNLGANYDALYLTDVADHSVVRFAANQSTMVPNTGAAASNFLTAGAKTLMLVGRLMGTNPPSSSPVFQTAHLLGDGLNNYQGIYAALGAAGALDPLYAYSYNTTAKSTSAPFSNGKFFCAIMRHSGGSIQLLLNDAAWTTAVTAGNTDVMTNGMRLGVHVPSGTMGGVLDLVHAATFNVGVSDAECYRLRDWALEVIGF